MSDAPHHSTDDELRHAHTNLLAMQGPSGLAGRLTVDQWIAANRLLDRKRSPSRVADSLGVDVELIIEMRNPRRCLARCKGDEKCFRECMREGR